MMKLMTMEIWFTLLFFAYSEPVRLADVIQHPKWKEDMNEELMAIEKNNTWQLTNLLKAHKEIDVKWVYKIKVKANGEIDRYKARLVQRDSSKEKAMITKKYFLL